MHLRAQGLDGAWPRQGAEGAGATGVAEAVRRLGYVQIDTIAVVERAHHHTLWQRLPGYAPEQLHDAQASDRAILEAWYPAASYVPMAHYRYTLPSMRANAEWYADNWRNTEAALRDEVLARLRAEGPLSSAEFAAPPGHKRAGWWDWKPAKRALEQLFVTGEVLVAERRSFQRVYDLAERVLPAGIDTTYPTDEAWGRFQAAQALASQGIAGTGNTRWTRARRTLLGEGLERLAEEGAATPVCIEGIERGRWYARPEDLASIDEIGSAPARARILSPFDSLVINRAWLKALWGFDYTIECYLPREKRRYGYFCLPILWGERFIGRVDARAERAAGILRVEGLWLEDGVTPDGELAAALDRALSEFAAFNGCASLTGRG